MNPDNIVFRIATWLIPLVFAIVLHEVSHGWVANAFGDPTAKRKRRLSLNPIRHVDPIGTVVLPLMLAVAGAPIFGWAKPVPVVARRMRNPRLHMMLVALAGPGMNIALAVLAALAFAALRPVASPDSFLWLFILVNLANFVIINFFLAVFNLLPIPPFDGSHVVEGLLPRPLVPRWRRLGRFGFPFLIFVLVLLPYLAPQVDVVGAVVDPPVRLLLGLLGLPIA
jgi:Zn-dependent protease